MKIPADDIPGLARELLARLERTEEYRAAPEQGPHPAACACLSCGIARRYACLEYDPALDPPPKKKRNRKKTGRWWTS